ncbi:hypothetical protein B14911_17590 [Bacillus sp. NRRL B-14911]|nr:hypothetical protein B14911_17590 [Bacillus sp. NRRL B-14911]
MVQTFPGSGTGDDRHTKEQLEELLLFLPRSEQKDERKW